MTDLERRLDRIESLLQQLLQQSGGVPSPPIPDGVGHNQARLMALARQDRAAAIAEARRLSRQATQANRKRRSQC